MCAEKEKKGRKNIKAVIRCKLVVFVCVCVCPIGDRVGWGVLPASPPQRQSGLDYHFTDRVPFSIHGNGVLETEISWRRRGSLKSILRRRELIDQISEGMMTV